MKKTIPSVAQINSVLDRLPPGPYTQVVIPNGDGRVYRLLDSNGKLFFRIVMDNPDDYAMVENMLSYIIGSQNILASLHSLTSQPVDKTTVSQDTPQP